ncbi:MAG: hypothetical protein U0324_27770 [Polyangiales bacterium]
MDALPHAAGPPLRGVPAPDGGLPVAFVLDSHMHAAAAVAASLRPTATLQLLGGARQTRSAEVAATLEHAVVRLGVRTVVVCGQDDGPPDASPLARALLADVRWLAEHLWLERVFREAGAVVEPMWLDARAGELHVWDRHARRLVPAGDGGLAAFVDRALSRARRTLPPP